MSEPPTDGPRGTGASGGRLALMSLGLTFFIVGVVFSLTMPDNIALGITFLALGVVFFTISGRKQPPSV
ncbi:MAG: hypothetical protein KIT89_04630 [Microcella sp.]|uniref:hypothetical protein n=1 Tax=Microcella sp. TaxID=1913979 RepID=UPI0024CB5504|nr:hypothetical protein [Microcella sp.]UYN84482.1 MAG: hypothetical protein KIT89_04630 [Microcella sp.]